MLYPSTIIRAIHIQSPSSIDTVQTSPPSKERSVAEGSSHATSDGQHHGVYYAQLSSEAQNNPSTQDISSLSTLNSTYRHNLGILPLPPPKTPDTPSSIALPDEGHSPLYPNCHPAQVINSLSAPAETQISSPYSSPNGPIIVVGASSLPIAPPSVTPQPFWTPDTPPVNATSPITEEENFSMVEPTNIPFASSLITSPSSEVPSSFLQYPTLANIPAGSYNVL